MKKLFIFAALGILLFSSIPVMAQPIPDDIHAYAEGEGFDHFREIAGYLNLNASCDVRDLLLGEGFVVNTMSDNLFSAEKFSDLLSDKEYWMYLITEPDKTALTFLEITHDSSGHLSSSGGGDSLAFSQAADKMRELIRKFGQQDDFSILLYEFNDYFFFYSFNGDERVIHVNPYNDDNEKYLTVKDYHELPTGEEALKAMQDEQRYYRKLMEENGGQVLYGGTDIHLSLHPYTSPWLICLIVLAAALPLLTAGIVLIHRKNNKTE